jgi:Na+:H+ antiporter, NhaA family
VSDRPPARELPRAQQLAERAFATLESFLHVEAVSGIVLLVAALAALLWANSPLQHSYHDLWHAPLTIGIGAWVIALPLHFWINDALMTVFFLVVGMEIRREISEGALRSFRQAALPLAAAVGGVIVPALVFFALNGEPPRRDGWAVGAATDIAFAVGVLALLGRGIPANVRVILLALAIIDDIIAVLIIAFFYTDGLQLQGLVLTGAGILLVLGMQRIGIGNAWLYVLPGVLTWVGMVQTGAHPTLSGVVLGLLTPMTQKPMRERPRHVISRVAGDLQQRDIDPVRDAGELARPLQQLRHAERELLPPAIRVQMALHPWVAFGVMPLFALANAGVSLHGVDLRGGGTQWVMLGAALALVAGKPLGVIGVSWLLVRLGWSHLPEGVTWRGIGLIGLLTGVGFTMSIFIATLAFADENLLGAAKLGVLAGSSAAAVLGLAWGFLFLRR